MIKTSSLSASVFTTIFVAGFAVAYLAYATDAYWTSAAVGACTILIAP